MRIAILSDIRGNLTALKAVLADLRQTAPDLILHGGDLAANGSAPAEVLDRIRDLGWLGVLGNADEMVFRPESLEAFASQSKAPASMWAAIREIAAATREALGADRLSWLSQLPMRQIHAPVLSEAKAPPSPKRKEPQAFHPTNQCAIVNRSAAALRLAPCRQSAFPPRSPFSRF